MARLAADRRRGRDVTMNWNLWRFAVDVELACEAGGRIGVTVTTDEPGLELAQTKFYTDNHWKEKWWQKFEVGVGYGEGHTGEVHAGWGGWTISA